MQEKARRSSRQRGVFKRGSHWYVCYFYKGKKIRESVGISYEAAVRALHARKLQIAEGSFEQQYGLRLNKGKPPTFNEFADRFIVEYCNAPNKKPSLREFHEKQLLVLRPFFGTMPLDQITSWHVRKFKAERAKQLSRNSGEPVSPKTVNRTMATLKRMFNVARQWEVVKENPCVGVEMYPEKQTKVEFLTPEECQSLIAAAEDYIQPVLLTAIHTGMRRGEVLSLTWDRIDLQNRIIRLDEGKTVKTEPEYVPIDDTLAEVLSQLPRQGDHVFMRHKGSGPLRDVRKPFIHALERSGIAEQRRRTGKPSLRFHDLRHTTASLMLMAGLPLESVQKMLRHKDITTTQRYAHLSRDYMKNAASVLDRFLSCDTLCDTVTESDPKPNLYVLGKSPYNTAVYTLRPHSSGG